MDADRKDIVRQEEGDNGPGFRVHLRSMDENSDSSSSNDIQQDVPGNAAQRNVNPECRLPVANPIAYAPEVMEASEEIIDGIVIESRQKNLKPIYLGFICTIIIIVVSITMIKKGDKTKIIDPVDMMPASPSLSPSVSMAPISTTEGMLLEKFLDFSDKEDLLDPTTVQHFAWKTIALKMKDGSYPMGEDVTDRYIIGVVAIGILKNLDSFKQSIRDTPFPPLCVLYKCNDKGEVQVLESRNHWSAGLGGGILHTEVGHLVGMTHLILTGGKFVGTIPSEIGNMEELQYLDLSDNLMTGTIPTEIGRLTNLRALNIQSNQLSGSIPSELGNLDNLSYLNVSMNQLTGTIPKELDDLKNLKAFSTMKNDIRGRVEFLCGNDFVSSEEFYRVEMDIGSQTPYVLSGDVGLFVDCQKMNRCSCCMCT